MTVTDDNQKLRAVYLSIATLQIQREPTANGAVMTPTTEFVNFGIKII
jgi:hypothetical protein